MGLQGLSSRTSHFHCRIPACPVHINVIFRTATISFCHWTWSEQRNDGFIQVHYLADLQNRGKLVWTRSDQQEMWGERVVSRNSAHTARADSHQEAFCLRATLPSNRSFEWKKEWQALFWSLCLELPLPSTMSELLKYLFSTADSFPELSPLSATRFGFCETLQNLCPLQLLLRITRSGESCNDC